MINRREALARLGGIFAGGWMAGLAGAQTTGSILQSTSTKVVKSAPVKGSFTVAHITDIHIKDGMHAPKWFAKCLHDIQSGPAKPDFLINTGDCVMDSLKSDRNEADALWNVWNTVLKGDNSLPIHHCLGNHDHWGLKLKSNNPLRKDVMFGKKLGLEKLGMDHPYYSFEHGGWHFIALDSVQALPVQETGWTGGLDDAQFEWLEKDLESIPSDRPVAIYSHLPIISVCYMQTRQPNKKGQYTLYPSGVFGDAHRVIQLFSKHKNVKLCLSGHLHLQDRIDLSGVTYICDGAICGKWWKGNFHSCPPGYSTVTFNPDGTFAHNYETYGWHEIQNLKAAG